MPIYKLQTIEGAGQPSGVSALKIGQRYKDTTDNSIWIAYGINQGEWKNIADNSEPQVSFLSVDANTIQAFIGFANNSGSAFTSESGNSNANTAWTLTGTKSVTSESITMDGTNLTIDAIEFTGTNNFLENNTSPLISGTVGDWTAEAILLSDNAPVGEDRWAGNLNVGATSGFQAFTNSSNDFRMVGYGPTYTTAITSPAFPVLTWHHVVVSIKQTAVGGFKTRIGFKANGLITDLTATGGSGQPDAVATNANANASFSTPALFLVGHGFAGTKATADRGWDGKIAEFRLSNIGRYW